MRNKGPPTRSSSLFRGHRLPRLLDRLRSVHGSVLHRILHGEDVLAIEIVSHSVLLGTISEVVTATSPLSPFNPHIVDLRPLSFRAHVEAIFVLRYLARKSLGSVSSKLVQFII